MLTTNPSPAQPTHEIDLSRSPLFTPWKDPSSGVVSYILTSRVAPLQQTFYFVNPSLTRDGRYYWFYCAFPPGGCSIYGRSLGVIDLWENRIHHFPETQFQCASPLVDVETGDVYWCSGAEIWRRSPNPSEKPVFINRFPEKLARNRYLKRMTTHFTLSADRKSLNLDAEIGAEWLVGQIPLDGSEPVVWQTFDRCYDHSQFSPTDPSLQLLARDNSVHPVTGEISHYENRLWLVRKGEQARPIFPSAIPMANPDPNKTTCDESEVHRTFKDARDWHGHEWWSTDGRHVWYVHYGVGVERVRLQEAPKPELIWKIRYVSHAHGNAGETLLVADCLPPSNPEEGRVAFLNRKTGQEINIVSLVPYADSDQARYHVHAHPQFCGDGRYICYTTTVLGGVDVAFTPVDALIEATS